ncbi:MAG: hypothetical protein EBU46_18290 [Nitrosomonadaceae bacterium]|nr:hypothetical protein [Nitrosomonadaceae bacterium]
MPARNVSIQRIVGDKPVSGGLDFKPIKWAKRRPVLTGRSPSSCTRDTEPPAFEVNDRQHEAASRAAGQYVQRQVRRRTVKEIEFPLV